MEFLEEKVKSSNDDYDKKTYIAKEVASTVD